MNKKFKILLIYTLTLFSSLSYSYNDESCISNIEELKKITIMTDPCLSMDQGIKVLKTDSATKLKQDKYKANDFMTQDEANAANEIDTAQNNSYFSMFELKNSFVDNFYKSNLLAFMMLVVIFKLMISFKKTKEEFVPILLLISIIYMIFSIALNTDTFSNSQSNMIIKTTTPFSNVIKQSVTTDFKTIELEIDDNSNTAINYIYQINEINMCMNRIQNNLLETLNNNNKIPNKSYFVDLYNKKNSGFVNGFEDMEKNRISYNLDRYGFVKNVEFFNCGNITFPLYTIDKDNLELIEEIKFKKLIKITIKNKDLSSGLESLKDYFELNYFMNDKYKHKLALLMTILTSEYKKGLLVGYVETDYNYQDFEIIETDFTNLQNILENSDLIYNKAIASQCIKNADVMNKSVNEFDLNDFESHKITLMDCFVVENDALKLATTDVFLYEENEDLVNLKIKILQEEGLEIAKISASGLVSDYENIGKDFSNHIDELFDFKEELAKLHNKGSFKTGEYLNFYRLNKHKYLQYTALISNPIKIDTSKSYPNFGADEEDQIRLNSFVISAFLQSLKNKIDTSKEIDLGLATNDILKYELDMSSKEIGNTLNYDKKSSNYLTDQKELILNSFRKVNNIVCNKNIEECSSKQNGVKNWAELGKSLSEDNGKIAISATAVYLASAKIENLTSREKDLDSIKLGSNKKNILKKFTNQSSSLIKTTSGFIAIISLIGFIIGELMLYVFKIQDFIQTFYLTAISISTQLTEIFILASVIVGLMISNSKSAYQKTIGLAITLYLSPIVISISSLLLVYITNVITYVLLSSLNYITSDLNILNNSTNEIFGYIIAFIMLILIIAFVLYKTIKLYGENNEKIKSLTDDFSDVFVNNATTLSFKMLVFGSVALSKASDFAKQGKGILNKKRNSDEEKVEDRPPKNEVPTK